MAARAGVDLVVLTAMMVVFDMDNTLACELGKEPRPGAVELLDRIEADGGFRLALWTSSTRERAKIILADVSDFVVER